VEPVTMAVFLLGKAKSFSTVLTEAYCSAAYMSRAAQEQRHGLAMT
jgi:hypothetical protein